MHLTSGACFAKAYFLRCHACLWQMDVRAGVAYGIIVDGFDGKFGTYELAITATQARLSSSISLEISTVLLTDILRSEISHRMRHPVYYMYLTAQYTLFPTCRA
jgi:hypothetical protein